MPESVLQTTVSRSGLARIVLAVVSVALLVGVVWERSRPALDRSLLTDDPCLAPCWQGLEPGGSTYNEALQVLENSKYVAQDTLESVSLAVPGAPMSVFTWEDRGRLFRGPLRRASNAITMRDGTVILLQIYPDIDYTFADVVAKIGTPEGVYAHPGGGHPSYMVYLDYPARGLTFESFVHKVDSSWMLPEPGRVMVWPEMRVTGVNAYAPSDLETALRDIFRVPPDRIDRILAGTQPWGGFGTVQITTVAR